MKDGGLGICAHEKLTVGDLMGVYTGFKVEEYKKIVSPYLFSDDFNNYFGSHPL